MQENDYASEPEVIETASEIAAAEGETKSIKRSNPLRQKAKAFIRFYTDIGTETYGNGTQSAIKAGYSKRSASAIATDLLQKALVREEIERAERERAKGFDWDFERWQKEIIAIFDALPSTNPQKLRAVELIGKAKGFIKDNQIQLNTLNIISDQDMTSIRQAVAADVSKRLAAKYEDSAREICGKALTKNHNSTAGGVDTNAPQQVV